MTNKKQLKLKTLQLNECFGLSKQFVITTEMHITKRCLTKSKHGPQKHCKTEVQNLSKAELKTKQQSKVTQKIHPLLMKFNDMQINRYDFRKYFCIPTSYECRSNYKNFPKREITIKNTNPFKFYLNPNVKINRAYTEPASVQEKIIAKTQATKVKRPLTTGKCRRFTQSVRQIGETSRIIRPKSGSVAFLSKQSKQKQQIIDPWETDNGYLCDF